MESWEGEYIYMHGVSHYPESCTMVLFHEVVWSASQGKSRKVFVLRGRGNLKLCAIN